MKNWKWIGLVCAGGMLLQTSTCANDIAYYVLQTAATQLVSALLAGVTA